MTHLQVAFLSVPHTRWDQWSKISASHTALKASKTGTTYMYTHLQQRIKPNIWWQNVSPCTHLQLLSVLLLNSCTECESSLIVINSHLPRLLPGFGAWLSHKLVESFVWRLHDRNDATGRHYSAGMTAQCYDTGLVMQPHVACSLVWLSLEYRYTCMWYTYTTTPQQ